MRANKAPKIPQDETQATYEGWCKQEHVQIDWQKPLQEIWNMVRGADPQPGALLGHSRGRTHEHDAPSRWMLRYGWWRSHINFLEACATSLS